MWTKFGANRLQTVACAALPHKSGQDRQTNRQTNILAKSKILASNNNTPEAANSGLCFTSLLPYPYTYGYEIWHG